MDAEETRAFLRQMTDELLDMVGRLKDGQRNDASIQAVNQIHGAGLALVAAAGLPPEAMEAARLSAVEALADLGYLDRAQANWMGARTRSRFAVPPEHDRRTEPSAAPVAGPRLVRVVPLRIEVGPDHAGATMVVTSLEVYEDRLLAHYVRLGGDPGNDDPARGGSWAWLAKDDTGLELRYAGGSEAGSRPFGTGTLTWMPAPAAQATSLFVTVDTSSGPELVVLPLSA